MSHHLSPVAGSSPAPSPEPRPEPSPDRGFPAAALLGARTAANLLADAGIDLDEPEHDPRSRAPLHDEIVAERYGPPSGPGPAPTPVQAPAPLRLVGRHRA